MKSTRLRGARTHNLKSLDLDLEPGTLTAIVGPSGAGKSSLAFGTLYAEGQRRYVESFSAYARNFLERLPRPPVEELEPVPAGIAVDRQGPVRTSRSTVGTMTEIADYAKILWARVAALHCPGCTRIVRRYSPSTAADEVFEELAGKKSVVLYPVAVHDPESFLVVRESLLADGYRRVRIGGEVRDLDGVRPSEVVKAPSKRKTKKKKPPPEPETLWVVADRTVVNAAARSRVVEALEMAMDRGGGQARVSPAKGDDLVFSSGLACPTCALVFRDPTPGMFSFNNPLGACDECRGFGRVITADFDKIIPDHSKTLAGGAIAAWKGKSASWERKMLKKYSATAGVPLDVPLQDLEPAHQQWLLEGDGRGWPHGWGGVRSWFDWLESRAYKMHVRVFLSRYRKYVECPSCHGDRLKPDSLNWQIHEHRIADFFRLPIHKAQGFVAELEKEHGADSATLLLLQECANRLAALADVGLDYLTLDRQSRTLSGGETQRVALTSALGSALTGAMFVLDEPTVGLHPVDVNRLTGVVQGLREGGNLVLAVEHDAEMIRCADRVIELGPGAGAQGGNITFSGTPHALAKKDTPTGRMLRGGAPERRVRRTYTHTVEIEGASGHNLKNVNLTIPIGVMSCVTGVSGSGKSSLVLETLVPAVQAKLGLASQGALPHDTIRGHGPIHDVVHVDQSPLGRTSRGNAATYLKVWDVFRARFSQDELAKERGYGPGFFSTNVPGGRCEVCKGQGFETVEMQFLADVTFPCAACNGLRFSGEVLDVRFEGLNVSEVLELTVDEVLERYDTYGSLCRKTRPLVEVGLGYLKLGQPLNTLSGGEAQRLKLAAALGKMKVGSLFVLDEPTAGLHAEDVKPLLVALDQIVDKGGTVVVVEHDMSVAAFADHVIDLGPGAGAAGGTIIAEGIPEKVAQSKCSQTAPFLRRALTGKRVSMKRSARSTVSTKGREVDARAIQVTGAREHNLRDVDIDIPQEKLVVVTGPSGSGKSTLAFDIVYAEGQRRFLETLSPYARQYMPQLPRPEVDRVIGVPPTVSLEQRMTRGGGNSTVATVTEIGHFLRLLYARVGKAPRSKQGEVSGRVQPEVFATQVRRKYGARPRVYVYAPVVQGRKGFHRDLLDKARRDGVDEARIDGVRVKLKEGLSLERYQEHDIDLLVDRLRVGDRDELIAAIRRAAAKTGGVVRIKGRRGELTGHVAEAEVVQYARGPDLDPRLFSFNTRQGACPVCEGKGEITVVQGRGKKAREIEEPCTACDGLRLSEKARSVLVQDEPITAYLSLSVSQARARLDALLFAGREEKIGGPLLQELDRRLSFLEEVGVGYLGLDRSANTLSGGETQRVRLAAQLGSGLTGVLYVLDEPTIGLHPRDTRQLIDALERLVEKGNSVLVVEHDADMIEAADYVIDVGPGGGIGGGRIVARGTPAALKKNKKSITGQALARGPEVPAGRRPTRGAEWIELVGAQANNLKKLDAKFPVGRLTAVTGVSGSGKSTLVREVLLRAVREELGLMTDPAGTFESIIGAERLERAVEVDQSPIGRTPRSVPATYVGVWDHIRKLLAGTVTARARGYTPSRFSFNVAEGRCPHCGGNGSLKVEMAFLPDVHVPCERCHGRRFTAETLDVTWADRSAGEILEMGIAEATELFASIPKVHHPLSLLDDLGLGYLKIGQASNTLSGGEAQRLKLVSEFGTGAKGKTLYVLDEPTTGLHRDDVSRLVRLLNLFVERGDTVIVIEHNTDVILASDWVVDLGPEGGTGGGRVVVQGTPEKVMKSKTSHTGAILRREMKRVRAR